MGNMFGLSIFYIYTSCIILNNHYSMRGPIYYVGIFLPDVPLTTLLYSLYQSSYKNVLFL